MRAFLPLLGGLLLASTGCTASVSVKFKTRDVQDNVVKTDTADFTGGTLKIQSEGVGTAVNGGVKVVVDPAATRVTATARMLAMVYAEDKSNGDLSIQDALETFTITHSGDQVVVTCGHGNTHGSSNAGESGCELLTVTIPPGTATSPLDLTVLSGNGTLTLQTASAVVSNLGANASGGDIEASLPATKGANISLVSETARDIDVTMPTGWSADAVSLQADADKIENSFTLTSTGGYGTAGAGLATLKLTSKEFAGSTGKVILH